MDSLKVLMLLDNPFLNDRRVFLEAKALTENGYNVRIICTKDNKSKTNEVINNITLQRIIDPLHFKIKNWSKLTTLAKNIIKNESFDVIHAHDQEMLNLGVLINKYAETKNPCLRFT